MTEMIDRVARALHDDFRKSWVGADQTAWDDLSGSAKDIAYSQARAAIEAMRGNHQPVHDVPGDLISIQMDGSVIVTTDGIYTVSGTTIPLTPTDEMVEAGAMATCRTLMEIAPGDYWPPIEEATDPKELLVARACIQAALSLTGGK